MARPRRLNLDPYDPQQYRVYSAENAAKLPVERLPTPEAIDVEIERVTASPIWQALNRDTRFKGQRIHHRRTKATNAFAT
jgi:hypothetical protein